MHHVHNWSAKRPSQSHIDTWHSKCRATITRLQGIHETTCPTTCLHWKSQGCWTFSCVLHCTHMKHIYVIVRKESDTWTSTVEQWACSLLLSSQMRNLCRLHKPSWYSRRKDWKRDHLKTTQCSVNIGSLNWTTLPSASCQNQQNSLKLKVYNIV
jgi:hypothetical protein